MRKYLTLLCVLAMLMQTGCTMFQEQGSLPRWNAASREMMADPSVPQTRAQSGYIPSPGKQKSGDDVRVELAPSQIYQPVGQEVVLVAGVVGSDGNYTMNSPLQWTLDAGSVGNFADIRKKEYRDWLAFDFSRSEKITGKYAVSTTIRSPLQLDRGTVDPTDDVFVERGQGWISLNSGRAGTSHVSVRAPSVYNATARTAFAKVIWVDVQWQLPAPVAAEVGQPAVLQTRVTKANATDSAMDWVVRYTITSGDAGFGPSMAKTIDIPVGSDNNACTQILQQNPCDAMAQVKVSLHRLTSPTQSQAIDLPAGSVNVTWGNPVAPIATEAGEVVESETPVETRDNTIFGHRDNADATAVNANGSAGDEPGKIAENARNTEGMQLLSPQPIEIESDSKLENFKVGDFRITPILKDSTQQTDGVFSPSFRVENVTNRLGTGRTVEASALQVVCTIGPKLKFADKSLPGKSAYLGRPKKSLKPGDAYTFNEINCQILPPNGPWKRGDYSATFNVYVVPTDFDPARGLSVAASGGVQVGSLTIPCEFRENVATKPNYDVILSKLPKEVQVGERVTVTMTFKNKSDQPFDKSMTGRGLALLLKYDEKAFRFIRSTPLDNTDNLTHHNNGIVGQVLNSFQPKASLSFAIILEATTEKGKATCAAYVKESVDSPEALAESTVQCRIVKDNHASKVALPNPGQEYDGMGAEVRPEDSHLKYTISAQQNSVSIGEEVVYSIVVENASDEDDSKIELVVQFPPGGGIVPVLNKTLPAKKARIHKDVPSVLTFAPIATLKSKEAKSFRVVGKTVKEGQMPVELLIRSKNLGSNLPGHVTGKRYHARAKQETIVVD